MISDIMKELANLPHEGKMCLVCCLILVVGLFYGMIKSEL